MGGEIAGVLFDLGGTLVDYDGPDARVRTLFELPEALARLVGNPS
jgi:hypothetical protein